MNALGKTARLWRTVRHLKPAQITGRVRFRLSRPKPDLSPTPARRALGGGLVTPAARRVSMTGPDTFLFLGEAGDLSRGWDAADVAKLWRYNLHYFDDLNALEAAARRDWHHGLIDRWIAENPPAKGTGWEPYPTSLRIVNWVQHALTGQALSKGAVTSLALQARWLTRRLEWHLLGNHLFVNAKALIFAGAFFDGIEAEAWMHTGLDILLRELPEQLLPDGGQFELSPMYHALMVEDLLDLVALAQATDLPALREMADRLRAVLPGALDWLDTMSHPDGEISFFNDAAIGIAPDNAQIFAYAARLGVDRGGASGSRFLTDSGYLRLEQGPAVVLADLARIGPDYLPGHAHADTLSLEVSLGNQRVIVNSGTSVYGTDAERLRQRGTPAHSTVTVAEDNSSEVWSGFRVGRRARPQIDKVTTQGATQGFDASHNGYAHLPGAPRHRREVALTDTSLTVTDHVTGGAQAEARYHLHPALTVAADASALTLPGGRVVRLTSSAPAHAEPSTYHPEFGVSQPNTCLVLPLTDGRAHLTLTWEAA